MPHPLQTALTWTEAGRSIALATVVSTWGSGPRRPGSVMVVAAEGDFAGSVSGGCVETAVVEAAQAAIESGTPELLEFGVSNDLAWEVGLACGGSVSVWVHPTPSPALLHTMVVAMGRGGGGVMYVDLDGGAAEWWPAGTAADGGGQRALYDNVTVTPLGPDMERHCRDALASARAEVVEVEDRRIFLHPIVPPLRVVIIGAVHIAQALAPMVVAAGYEVVIVDPRGLFASEDRFPEVEVIQAWPLEAFRELEIDARTAVVALTHDPKFDDPALAAALEAGAGYVGALGSRRSHEKRTERLLEAGVSEAAVGRIRAPVGLDLGGRAPGEIAAAILAEIIRDTTSSEPYRNQRSVL